MTGTPAFPPRVRVVSASSARPWIAQIPDAQGRIVESQAFATRADAEAWARAAWCARHHRKTCPPILWDRSVHGNLRHAAFRRHLARWYTTRYAGRDAVVYHRIPQRSIQGIPTDAWDPPTLARTRTTPEAERLVPTAREWDEDPLVTLDWAGDAAATDYAGALSDEDGAPTAFPTDRVVYVCPGVTHEVAPRRVGATWIFAPDTSRILWSPGAHRGDPPMVWGAFLTESAARTYAFAVLDVDYVAPRYDATVAGLDWDGLVPLRGIPDPAAPPDPAADLPALLALLTATAYAAPIRPHGPWTIVRQQPDTGAPEWLSPNARAWHADARKRWEVSAPTALSDAFSTWCAARQIAILPALPTWALGVR